MAEYSPRHVYAGSPMHMGDCAICGNAAGHPIHAAAAPVDFRDLYERGRGGHGDGYAINEPGKGGILVNTVHTTRRGAIVNWLVTRKDIKVTADWTDDMIEQMWRAMRDERTFCIRIEVHAVQGPAANVTEQVDG